MSNWLAAIVALLIIIILADGLRRTWQARRNRLGVSPNLKKSLRSAEPEFEEVQEPAFSSELPNGGARVIGVRDPSEVSSREPRLTARDRKEMRRREELAKRTPEQARLNLDEEVPMLMESVEADSERLEPHFSAVDDSHSELDEPHYDGSDESDYDAEDDDEEDYEEGYDDEDYEDDEESVEEEAKSPPPEPEEVFIINIMAPKGEFFQGAALLDIVLKCGLRYGSMDIFHRYKDLKGEGALLFSMANMVKPGTFDLDAMDEFSTPGISLFMTLPIDADSMQSFELMVETAQAISQTLGGELKDEQRSAMTRQTLEHCRQRIRDFERKKLFRRPR